MRNFLLAGLSALILLLPSCGKGGADGYVTLDGFALGTTYHFVIRERDTTGLQSAVDSLFEVIEGSMSVYRENSLICRVNRNETDSIDEHIARCIEIAAQASELSGGEYDITVRPLTQALGFNADPAQDDPDIDSLLQYVGYRKIRTGNGRLIKDDPGIQLDLNSVAKGYTVDLLGELVRGRGVADYLVEVGGEVVCRGVNPSGKRWRVGIDEPQEGNNIPGASLQAVITLDGGALATSGNYRKFYTDERGRKVAHIINALTGRNGVGDILSSTVVAPSCALADAYSTMFMVIGFERTLEFLENHTEIVAYLIYEGPDGGYSTYASPGLEYEIVE